MVNTILDVPDDNAVLVFSMVGYITQEIPVKGKEVINVVLKNSNSSLDEVTIVGFGTQKKISVVSSITTIEPKELKGPTGNLTTMMSGRVAGMIAYQRSGEPGQDNANFFIRGLGSFGAGKVDPLILIDGMESTPTDLARLQADDIASFSVLKDATAAAVYGARGANGVVLVNTKSGKSGKTKFNFRAENSVSSNTRNFQFADNITYMNLANEAALTRNPLAVLPYSQNKIDRTIAGDDSFLYPNNNWIDLLIKDNTLNQRYNMNVSGGGANARFYLAGTYNIDNGILKVDERNNFNSNIKLKNYSVRSNLNLNLTPSTEGIVRVYAQFDDYTGPVGGGSAVFNAAMWSNPVMFPAVYPSNYLPYINHPLFGNAVRTGTSGTGLYVNPYANSVNGYSELNTSAIKAQVELKQNFGFLVPGLSARVMSFVDRYSTFGANREYNPFYYNVSIINGQPLISALNEGGANSIGLAGTEYLGYSPALRNQNSRFYLEAAANYNRNFRKHAITGMLITLFSDYLNGNAGDLQASLPARNQGVSGRFTYGYDNKYLTEFNFGYNGSERFSSSQRFGFFPSIGLGYVISNESFFKPLLPVISNLKFRATYGLVGNDQIGASSDRFFYLSNVNMNDGGRGAVFGQDFTYSRPGVSISRYPNELISWERSKQINLGVNMQLFRSVDLVIDAFKQTRSSILMPRSFIPTTMGLQSAISANVGKAESRGIDGTISYNKSLGRSLYIQSRGNFTYAKSKILVYDEPVYEASLSHLYRAGNPVNQYYGYVAERLFVDDYEVENSPSQNFGGSGIYRTRGGDIKYRDINGDGVISSSDMVPLGHPTTPEIVYGFGGTVGFKGFDFSAFFQGVARTSLFINPDNITPFAFDRGNAGYQNGLLKVVADNHWSEENRNSYAFWPRLADSFVSNNTQPSSWWMRDGSFLRLKNVEIGYTPSKKILDKIKVSNMRIYVNGSNFFSISKFKLWDPEMGGNGLNYPVQRVYNLGVNMGF